MIINGCNQKIGTITIVVLILYVIINVFCYQIIAIIVIKFFLNVKKLGFSFVTDCRRNIYLFIFILFFELLYVLYILFYTLYIFIIYYIYYILFFEIYNFAWFASSLINVTSL